MGKVIWKSGTFEYPIPAALVSCGDMENSNILTVAWTGIVNTDPAMCYISVRDSRYSYELINKTKEFVINLTTTDLAYETDWCGVRSGRQFDKFKETGLTKEKCEFVKCPRIKESPVSIECRVVETKKLGSHVMFLAKIMSIDADDQYIDEKGAFDISKCNLIAYANGGYYALGKKVGSFGYSVKKKSTKRKQAAANKTNRTNSKKVAKKNTTVKKQTSKKVTKSKVTKKNSKKKK